MISYDLDLTQMIKIKNKLWKVLDCVKLNWRKKKYYLFMGESSKPNKWLWINHEYSTPETLDRQNKIQSVFSSSPSHPPPLDVLVDEISKVAATSPSRKVFIHSVDCEGLMHAPLHPRPPCPCHQRRRCPSHLHRRSPPLLYRTRGFSITWACSRPIPTPERDVWVGRHNCVLAGADDGRRRRGGEGGGEVTNGKLVRRGQCSCCLRWWCWGWLMC